MKELNVTVGLDVGTEKTVVIVAEGNSNSFRLAGIGECPTVGVRKGVVVDIDNVVRSIQQAVKKAEKMAGMKVLSAYVGYAGTSVAVRKKKFILAIDGIRRGIVRSGYESMLLALKPERMPPGEKIMHIILEQSGCQIASVVEACGMKLEAMVVSGRAFDIQTLAQSVSRAGIAVKEVVFSPLAAAAVLLSPAEREYGAILLKIGAGTTSVTVFKKNSIVHTMVLPVGGEHITSDLAIGLHTSLAKAEEVQKDFGRVVSAEKEFTATNISVETVAAIIEPRLLEILDLVKGAMESFRYQELLPGGIVLTGGVSLLPGLPSMVQSYFNLPVRVGVIKIGDLVWGPAYVDCIGLVKYGFLKISTGGLRYA